MFPRGKLRPCKSLPHFEWMILFLPISLQPILAVTWLLGEWIQSAKSSGWSGTAHLGSSQLLDLFCVLYQHPFPLIILTRFLCCVLVSHWCCLSNFLDLHLFNQNAVKSTFPHRAAPLGFWGQKQKVCFICSRFS